MTHRFAVTWDYRCPFARNAHEHVLAGLADQPDWEVEFVPFSLNQAHVAEGEPDVWGDDSKSTGLLAMEVGIAVRDHWFDAFGAVHRALFAARHDEGLDLRDEAVLRNVLKAQGLDDEKVFEQVDTGEPRATFRREHEAAVRDHNVWGVPTFIADGQSVFVRLMDRPGDDHERGRRTIERVVDLVTGWPDLNEFKHTSIPR